MAPRALSMWMGLAGLFVAIGGCASIEFAPAPRTPEISVKPRPDSVEHASPPALGSDTAAATSPALAPEEASEPLHLTVEGAIVLALQNNQSLVVEEVNPAIQQTYVSEQRAVFDPTLAASYTHAEDRLRRDLLFQTPVGGAAGTNATVVNRVETEAKTHTDAGNTGLSVTLPTGTDVAVSGGPSRTTLRNRTSNADLADANDTTVNASTVQLTVTQRLLRGAWLGVNLASLRQARLDKLATEYELRGFVEDLVSQVEQTYWDCVLAQRRIDIYEESLNVAQAQADEVEARINVGQIPETERAAAVAEVAQRRSSLIDARSNLATLRLTLARLLNPSSDAMRAADIQLQSEPLTPEMDLAQVEDSVRLACRMRPDLNQARLQIKRDELEVVKTKNGLLPQLDLFLTLSKDLNRTGYADSFSVARRDIRDEDYSTQAGIEFSYPLGNRSARARDLRAALVRERDFEALANMTQLVEQDVRSAYIEVGRAHEQIAATAATRQLQEETLKVETEKFRLGRSNPLLVAQAQRDLLNAQINEVQASAAYLKAIVNLYALEGSLLERRGVVCPGREPVDLEKAAPRPIITRSTGAQSAEDKMAK